MPYRDGEDPREVYNDSFWAQALKDLGLMTFQGTPYERYVRMLVACGVPERRAEYVLYMAISDVKAEMFNKVLEMGAGAFMRWWRR